MQTTRNLEESIKNWNSYYSRSLKYLNHPAGVKSEFWAKCIDERNNYPDLNEFIGFRRNKDYMNDIGEYKYSSKIEREEKFEMIKKITLMTTPLEFIESFEEPIIGSPLTTKIGNSNFSYSFISNLGTTYRIINILEKLGLKNKKLKIAEIGAGWGCMAFQLHQKLNIESYTIVDLPENLYLSSNFLKSSLPNKTNQFVDCKPNHVCKETKELNFSFPSGIDNLNGPYDLIINTSSMQEMSRLNVETYFKWINRVLSDKGNFISFNGNYSSEITNTSEYLAFGLELYDFAPFYEIFPKVIYNNEPYEMIFRKGCTASKDQMKLIDISGKLMQLGLRDELKPLIDLMFNRIPPTTILSEAINLLNKLCFSDDEKKRKELLLKNYLNHHYLIRFTVANLCFAYGFYKQSKSLLISCRKERINNFADLRIEIMLSLINKEKISRKLIDSSSFLKNDVEEILLKNQCYLFSYYISSIFKIKHNFSFNSLLSRINLKLKKYLKKSFNLA